MHEVPPRPTDLPDPFVGLIPVLLQEVEQLALETPSVLVEVKAGLPGQGQGVDDFAVGVKLPLIDGGVADPYRSGLLVARQPADIPFRQPAFATDAIHDLHIARVAGDRAAEPLAPAVSLVGVAGPQQG